MRQATVLVAALLCGCGGARFASEGDEIAYLKSLREPSPSQFARRLELQRALIDRETRLAGDCNERKDYRRAVVYYRHLLGEIGDDPALREERVHVENLLEFAKLHSDERAAKSLEAMARGEEDPDR